MTDLKERARTLAAYALRDARAGDYTAASKHVPAQRRMRRRGNDDRRLRMVRHSRRTVGYQRDSGPLALGWKDAETGRVHAGAEGVPDRVQWAGG